MTFQPVIPTSGLTGWRFLQRTYDSQLASFAAAPQISRDADYFTEKIANITSAEALVADTRLLRVALGAFGLQDDIQNRFFIRKVLEEGTSASDALANRLSDSRYAELAEAFGFGPDEQPRTDKPGFAADIVSRFEATQFEVAAGSTDDAIRSALYAQRVLETLPGTSASQDAVWFNILGDPPLRRVFEGAFRLPEAVGQIDIDQQLATFKERARRFLGSDDPAIFTSEAARDRLIDDYLLQQQVSAGASLSPTAIALTLLGGNSL